MAIMSLLLGTASSKTTIAVALEKSPLNQDDRLPGTSGSSKHVVGLLSPEQA
jgi:hypothetical protein